MPDRSPIATASRWLGMLAMGLLALSAVSCRARQPAPEQSSPLGMVESSAPIGPSKMSLEQVQAEVEAFADQYVLQISEATNQAARSHPEARPRLHAIKLSIARGAYIIASGPNPVVSVLDLVVQATLVHRTAPGTLARSLPEEIRAPLVEVIERLHNDAWRLAERVLTPQDLTDLRSLIDAWIEENPNAVYVAGVRFSDFARLRPTPGGSSPTSIFGLLRVDPFASIDPAAREIQESRLLAERMFYYVQRMPQLLAWGAESLYFDIARAPESQQLLTSVDAFAKSAEQLNQTIAELPTRTREELAQSEETVSNLLSQMNAALDQTSKTLAHVDQSSANLRDASQAVADAGKAWEATADAVGEAAAILNPPKPPGAPASEPVTIHDVTAALQEAQTTAIEMRKLLEEFSAAAKEGGFVTSVNTSVIEARRGAQDVVITIAVCAAALIVMVFACALIYRATVRRWSPTRST